MPEPSQNPSPPPGPENPEKPEDQEAAETPIEKPSAAVSNRLLIVDDDLDIQRVFGDIAERLGCEVRTATNGKEFWIQYDLFEPEAVILDLVMPETDGIALMRQLAEKASRVKILLISGSESKVINAAERLGEGWNLSIQGSLQKPVSVTNLENLLRRTFSLRPSLGEDQLEAAIEAGEVVPFFQPKVTLGAETTIIGLEVLARWEHPELGILLPADFIHLAERSNLIDTLTDSLLNQALTALKACHEKGVKVPIFLNLSAASLTDITLPDRLAAMVDRQGLEHSMLTLEVTESSTAGTVPEMMDVLARSRLKGFELSMDDFGTGYSSLLQLVRLPFNELKIDQSFIHELGRHREAEIVVRSAISLAHSLRMRVCAEGVETRRALAILEDAGCDAIQGELVSEPVPADYLPTLIRRWKTSRDKSSP